MPRVPACWEQFNPFKVQSPIRGLGRSSSWATNFELTKRGHGRCGGFRGRAF